MRWILLTSVFAAALPLSANAMDRSACQAAVQYSNAHDGVAVLVLEHGRTVCEAYRGGGAGDAHELWSGTKSFVGIMAAAAVQDGLLALDDRAADTLVEWREDPIKTGITIRQLLSMASGQPSEIGKPPTYRGSLDVPLVAKPGERFIYGATPMQSFGELLRRKLVASGQPGDLAAYIDRRILVPVGIRYAAWRRGADGNVLLPQGLRMTAREWAKLGEFVRAGGRSDGKALVDPAAFRALFKPSQANPAYGLTWWLPHPASVPDPITAATDIGRRGTELPTDLVEAAGAGDQRLYVIPSRGLTIVRQAQLDLVALAAGRVEPGGWSDADFLKLLLGPG